MTRARGKHTKARATTPVGREAGHNRAGVAAIAAGRRETVAREQVIVRNVWIYGGADLPVAEDRPDVTL